MAEQGLCVIRRDVIQTMFDKYPEFKYNNDLNIDAKFEPPHVCII